VALLAGTTVPERLASLARQGSAQAIDPSLSQFIKPGSIDRAGFSVARVSTLDRSHDVAMSTHYVANGSRRRALAKMPTNKA
jgi:hypothetical protein